MLIADNEQAITDTLAIILRQHGFDPTAAYSGEQAVEAAGICRPDALICDIVMNGMNGIEAAMQIRALLPRCRIILISGAAATADLLDDARLQGHHFDVLAKPFHPKELIARLLS